MTEENCQQRAGSPEDIEKCTDALIAAVKQSDAYKRFEAAKEKLTHYEELRAGLDAFRKKLFTVPRQVSEEELPHVMEELCAEQRELYSSPVIAEYITSEQELCFLIRRQYLRLAGIADFEIANVIDQV